MSSDQRPGKVRVFSSGTMPEPAARRREDHADLGSGSPAVAAESAVDRPDKPAAVTNFGLIVRFMLGCAGGGALLAWVGLMPGGGL